MVPKDQYVVMENTHKAIIEKEKFDKVQFLLMKRSINKKNKHEYLLRGLIKCKNCKSNLEVGAKLNSKGRTIKNPIPYITCRNSRKGLCPAQHLNYNKFENEIIEYLKDFLIMYVNKSDLENVYKKYSNINFDTKEKLNEDIEIINNKIDILSIQIDKIYFDKINNIINENDYFRYTQKLNDDKVLLEQKLQNTKSKIQNQMVKGDGKMSDIINEFLNNPSKKVIYELIDYIEIDENKNVKINFSFSSLV